MILITRFVQYTSELSIIGLAPSHHSANQLITDDYDNKIRDVIIDQMVVPNRGPGLTRRFGFYDPSRPESNAYAGYTAETGVSNQEQIEELKLDPHIQWNKTEVPMLRLLDIQDF